MSTNQGRFVVGLLSLSLLLTASCGGDDDDTVSEGGTSGMTGGDGGSPGGSGGSGGSSAGGASGGTSASGGASGDGGTASELDERIRATCANWQANGYVHGCTAVNADGYVTDCTAELVDAAVSCEAEVEALLDCSSMLTALDYECDADHDISFATGVCSAETADLDDCAS